MSAYHTAVPQPSSPACVTCLIESPRPIFRCAVFLCGGPPEDSLKQVDVDSRLLDFESDGKLIETPELISSRPLHCRHIHVCRRPEVPGWDQWNPCEDSWTNASWHDASPLEI